MAKSKIKDFDQMERDFREGKISICQIARNQGVTDGYIHHIAKKRGWKRDLSDKIRLRVREKVLPDRENLDEEEIIDKAAAKGAAIIKKHQELLKDVRGLASTLTKHVKKQAVTAGVTDDTASASAQLNQIAAALNRVVQLERKSYNLDDPENKEENDALVIKFEGLD